MLSPRSRLQARSARADKCGVVTCIQDGGGLFFFFFVCPHLQLLAIMLFLLTNEAEYTVRFALLAGVMWNNLYVYTFSLYLIGIWSYNPTHAFKVTTAGELRLIEILNSPRSKRTRLYFCSPNISWTTRTKNSHIVVYPQSCFPVKLKDNALAYTFPFHNILWVWFTARL